MKKDDSLFLELGTYLKSPQLLNYAALKTEFAVDGQRPTILNRVASSSHIRNEWDGTSFALYQTVFIC